jgi:hypothetical protein
LNKDGYLDIVTANENADSVSVLFGNPAGAFSTPTNSPYSVGKNPRSVAIADLNRDGSLDIVTANYGANSVTVLLGNSIGTFAPSPNPPYVVASGPISVAIADLNKDGYLDIVTANEKDNSVSVLLGNSIGTFAPSPNSPYSAGTRPYSVAIADLNKDGNLDIVAANFDSNSVSILFGNSGEAFSPATTSRYFVGTKPYSVTVTDLNKDSYLDIVTADYGSNSVSVLLGGSGGTFSSSPNSPYSVGPNPYSVAIGDLNKDGYLDIVAAIFNPSTVSVLLGSSGGAFYQSTSSPYYVEGGPSSVAIGDLNKDGNLDIVTANAGSSSVSVIFGTIDGPFSQSIDRFIESKTQSYAIPTAFFAVGLSMGLYLLKQQLELKQQLDSLTTYTRQLNARLDAGAALEKKASPDSELPPYTAPITQDLPGAKLAGVDGVEAQAVVPE